MKHSLSLIAAAAAALMLVACDRRDQTASQPSDSTVASADSTAERAQADAAAAQDRVGAAADNAADRVESAGATVGDKVADAAITASVNAALARDPSLSALGINVDTANGAVSLKGTAPDEAARARATELAQGVQGVTSVDNQLQVGG